MSTTEEPAIKQNTFEKEIIPVVVLLAGAVGLAMLVFLFLFKQIDINRSFLVGCACTVAVLEICLIAYALIIIFRIWKLIGRVSVDEVDRKNLAELQAKFSDSALEFLLESESSIPTKSFQLDTIVEQIRQCEVRLAKRQAYRKAVTIAAVLLVGVSGLEAALFLLFCR